jgi:hypothetical protein
MDWKAAEKQKPQQFQADDHPIGRLLQDCEDALCSHRTQRDEQKAVIEQLYATVWSDKDTTARRVPLHMRREWETRNTPERCKLTLESRGETFQIMLGTETRTSRTDWKFRGFAKTSTMKAEPAALQANGVTAVENANRLGNCRCLIVDNYFFNALPGFPGGCGQLIQVWGGRPATPGAVADGRFWFTCRGVENPDEIYILEIEA